MKTPNHPLAAASLLLLASAAFAASASSPDPTNPGADAGAAAGAAAGGMVVLPKDFIGPPAPGQCIAGSAGCGSTPSAAAASASAGAALNELDPIGRQQRAAAGVSAADPQIIAFEDGMVKSGQLSSIDRSAAGAVYHFPDGSVAWSDYVKGFETIPMKPDDPRLPQEARDLLAKEQANKQKAAADKELAAKNCAQFAGDPSCAEKGKTGFKMASNDPSAPHEETGKTQDAATTGDAADGTNGDSNQYAYNQGLGIGDAASNGSGGPGASGGPAGSSSGGTGRQSARDSSQKASEAATHDVTSSLAGGDPSALADHLTYTNLQQFARGEKGDAVRALHQSAGAPAAAPSPEDDAVSAPAGTNFFNNKR